MKSMRILVILAAVTMVLSMSVILLEAKDDVTVGNKSAFEVTALKENSKEDNLTESISSKIGQLLICAIIVIALVCGLLGMMVYVHFIKPKKAKSSDIGEEIRKLHESVGELKDKVDRNIKDIEGIREFIEERFLEERLRR